MRKCGTHLRSTGSYDHEVLVVWWLFDSVIGDALRSVGHRDRAALLEPEGPKRALRWSVVLVSVAEQVLSMFSREREDCLSDTASAHSGHAVNHVVVGIGIPRAIDQRVGLVWPGSERKDGEGPFVVGHEETVSARDVFFSVNAVRVPFGPLSRIPVRLHERAGMRICALNELEVLRESDLNLHIEIVSANQDMAGNLLTMWS